MLNIRWYFNIVFFVNTMFLHAQLPGCNASAVSVDSVFLPNTISTHVDIFENWKKLLLCGPNTVVYDTLHDTLNQPIREMVFVGGYSKYVGKGINHLDANAIYVKSTATLELRPAVTQNSILFLIVEPGATILNFSGFPFYNIDTCSSLIFPPGCSSTGVLDNVNSKLEALRLWPNPAKEYLHLDYSFVGEEPPIIINLYNSYGQLVQEQKPVFESKKTTIPIGSLDSGLYLLELKNSSGTIAKEHFLVAK